MGTTLAIAISLSCLMAGSAYSSEMQTQYAAEPSARAGCMHPPPGGHMRHETAESSNGGEWARKQGQNGTPDDPLPQFANGQRPQGMPLHDGEHRHRHRDCHAP